MEHVLALRQNRSEGSKVNSRSPDTNSLFVTVGNSEREVKRILLYFSFFLVYQRLVSENSRPRFPSGFVYLLSCFVQGQKPRTETVVKKRRKYEENARKGTGHFNITMRVIILGAGISGLAIALALSKELSPLVRELEIDIFELRDGPSTGGGAVNLNPVAQRHLDQLGVLQELDKFGAEAGAVVNAIEIFSMHSGRKIGNVDFAGRNNQGYGGYKGRRVMRSTLHKALLTAIGKRHNIELHFGKKVVDGIENDDGIVMFFEDETSVVGDVALGCDGVHSNTRTNIVDPDRVSAYTGISFIQSFMPASLIKAPLHFETTAMNRSCRGSLLTTFCDMQRQDLFVSAFAEVSATVIANGLLRSPEEDSSPSKRFSVRTLREDLHRRFSRATQPCIRQIIEKCPDWTLYPVYEVSPGGIWSTKRIMLIGDAAHAMPPKDESAAYALDDAILFSRIFTRYIDEPLPVAFKAYEAMRRGPIDEAYKAATESWNENKDTSYLSRKFGDWLTPWNLRKTRKTRSDVWMSDAQSVAINVPDPSRVFRDIGTGSSGASASESGSWLT